MKVNSSITAGGSVLRGFKLDLIGDECGEVTDIVSLSKSVT